MSKEKKTDEAADAPKKDVAARFKLANGNQGTFRVSVRNNKGGIVRTVEFPPGQVVEVDDEELKAIVDKQAIRTAPNTGALLEVDEKKHPLDKPSAAVEKATKARADAIAKDKAERDAKFKAEQEGTPLSHDGTPPQRRGK